MTFEQFNKLCDFFDDLGLDEDNSIKCALEVIKILELKPVETMGEFLFKAKKYLSED